MATQIVTETVPKHRIDPDQIELHSLPTENQVIPPMDRQINEETVLNRRNLLKVIAASISFFFAGNNDGSLGALTPYILRTYNVGTEYVALMYVQTLPYLLSHMKSNNLQHHP
jgi:hypothetical protein